MAGDAGRRGGRGPGRGHHRHPDPEDARRLFRPGDHRLCRGDPGADRKHQSTGAFQGQRTPRPAHQPEGKLLRRLPVHQQSELLLHHAGAAAGGARGDGAADALQARLLPLGGGRGPGGGAGAGRERRQVQAAGDGALLLLHRAGGDLLRPAHALHCATEHLRSQPLLRDRLHRPDRRPRHDPRPGPRRAAAAAAQRADAQLSRGPAAGDAPGDLRTDPGPGDDLPAPRHPGAPHPPVPTPHRRRNGQDEDTLPKAKEAVKL